MNAPLQQPQQSNDVSVGVGGKSESLQRHAQELGVIGKLFGSSEHAPLNIAGIILVLCVLAMLATAFLPVSGNVPAADLLKMLGAIALASLTFLGGYLGGRARP